MFIIKNMKQLKQVSYEKHASYSRQCDFITEIMWIVPGDMD